MKTPLFSVIAAIARKDIQAEFRTREIISVMGIFALLSILIFSFALELDRVARQEAISGVLWVTVVFASILGLNRSMAMEREQANIDAMLLAPIDRSGIFFGKLFGNFVFALVVGLILLPIMTLLYNLPLVNLWLFIVLVMGTLGFSTVGTLLAAMTVQTRARESLLPIVMLPVALPVMLAAIRGTTGILNAAPVGDWFDWLRILVIVDLVYLALCYTLFDFVIEE